MAALKARRIRGFLENAAVKIVAQIKDRLSGDEPCFCGRVEQKIGYHVCGQGSDVYIFRVP